MKKVGANAWMGERVAVDRVEPRRDGHRYHGRLLRGLERRDLSALESVYDHHIDHAWKLAVLVCADRAAAEDAVAAAFLKLWRDPGTSDPGTLGARLLACIWNSASGTGCAAAAAQ